MRTLTQLREDELLVIISRAAAELARRTDYVNADDYEPDTEDQTHWMNRFADETNREANGWLWERHGFGYENHIGEALIDIR
jgi:hypothetical protein